MAQRQIYCDTSDLEKDIKEVRKVLSEQSIHAAMASALNRTLTFVGAETKRQVKAEYALTKSINKSLMMEKATRSKLVAAANYTDKPLPMFLFKHSVPPNQTRSPISVTIKKSNGAKTVGYSNGSAVFKAFGDSKITKRKLGQRNLKTAYTVSIPQMVSNEEVYDVIAEKAEEKLIERFNHEIEWRMSKI